MNSTIKCRRYINLSISFYDCTTLRSAIGRAALCTGCTARCTGTSKTPAAISIATIATDTNRSSSSCDYGSEHDRCFRRTYEIHWQLLQEIRRQEVSYALPA